MKLRYKREEQKAQREVVKSRELKRVKAEGKRGKREQGERKE